MEEMQEVQGAPGARQEPGFMPSKYITVVLISIKTQSRPGVFHSLIKYAMYGNWFQVFPPLSSRSKTSCIVGLVVSWYLI